MLDPAHTRRTQAESSAAEAPAFVYQRRVRWSEVDAAGMWKFVSALQYLEEAEVELLRHANILEHTYPAVPRVYVDAQFHRSARFDDMVDVHLGIARVGVTSIQYGWRIMHEGLLAADGRLVVSHVDKEGSSCALPDCVREALNGLLDAAQPPASNVTGRRPTTSLISEAAS